MRVEIDDEALAEVCEARDYYAAVRSELGRDFVTEVDRAISRVLANPLTIARRDEFYGAEPREESNGIMLTIDIVAAFMRLKSRRRTLAGGAPAATRGRLPP